MRTLLDANRALVSDLPTGYLKRTHWMNAGQLLVAAAESGLEADVRSATEALVSALVTEGWMTHRRK